MRWVFPGPKNSPKYGTLGLGRVFVIELQLKHHSCGRWESSLQLGDISRMLPFDREFWWRMYGLGAISRGKSPNFGDFTT